ncbi:MAG: UvrB/UvrC motif-containing protein [Sarcina sp.]
MICEKCKEKEATIKLIKVVEGKKEIYMLCEDCVNNLGEIVLEGEIDDIDNFDFNKILSGLVDYLNKNNDKKELEINSVCEKCGTRYEELKETGIIGCSECYKVFELGLIPMVNRYHGSSYHMGSKKFAYITQEDSSLENLQQELEEAVKFEEYEKAAILRDAIKDLKNYDGGTQV